MKRLTATLLLLLATSYQLRATSCELQANSYELGATSYELQANSYELLTAGEEQEKDGDTAQRKEKVVNFGLKGGFTSSLFLVNDLSMGSVSIDEFQNKYRIGYFVSLFLRINFGHYFLQPEASYNVNRSSLTFIFPENVNTSTATAGQEVFIETDIHSFDVPILFGWNIIKEHPYSLAIVGGPKLRYIWGKKSKTNFNNLSRQQISEQLRPFNLGLSVGVAVTIHPVFFDCRYDIGLNNISKRVVYEFPEGATAAGNEPHIRFAHRDNVLSFSLGILF